MPENAETNRAPADALTASNVSKWIGFLLPILVAIAVTYSGIKIGEFKLEQVSARVVTIERDGTESARRNHEELLRQQSEIARISTRGDADHAFLMSVAENLQLFMCSTNREYCRGRKP